MTTIDRMLNKRPKILNNYLNMYGNIKIITIIICRKPVSKIYQQILNIVSMGEFNKNKKKYLYDNVFHLYIIMIFDNGTQLKIEKNQRINISKNVELGTENIYLYNVNITFNELINNAERFVSLKDLYRYNAFSTNCQHFILSILQTNYLMNQQIKNFILQSVGELITNNIIKHASQSITDVAAVSDYLIKGGIIPKNINKSMLKKNINMLII